MKTLANTGLLVKVDTERLNKAARTHRHPRALILQHQVWFDSAGRDHWWGISCGCFCDWHISEEGQDVDFYRTIPFSSRVQWKTSMKLTYEPRAINRILQRIDPRLFFYSPNTIGRLSGNDKDKIRGAEVYKCSVNAASTILVKQKATPQVITVMKRYMERSCDTNWNAHSKPGVCGKWRIFWL